MCAISLKKKMTGNTFDILQHVWKVIQQSNILESTYLPLFQQDDNQKYLDYGLTKFFTSIKIY